MCFFYIFDWYLGQNFYSKSCVVEYDVFFIWLLDCVQEYEVDVIIVVGDIFDIGLLLSYVCELYNCFVVQLQQIGCCLVVLVGNYDLVVMFNEFCDIFVFLYIIVVVNVGYVLIELLLCDGMLGVIFCLVLFLCLCELVISQVGYFGWEKQQLLLYVISDYYQEQYQQVCVLCGDWLLFIIVSGYLIIVGVSKSDVVCDIYIGILDVFLV